MPTAKKSARPNILKVPTCVYRLFDAEGNLLYVGISEKLDRRLRAHAKSKHWWPEVARHGVEWFPTRYPAEVEEVRAIRAEGPRYNVRHSVSAELVPLTCVRVPRGLWAEAKSNIAAEGLQFGDVFARFLEDYNAAAYERESEAKSAES